MRNEKKKKRGQEKVVIFIDSAEGRYVPEETKIPPYHFY
jgi:hypothetical protein